MASLLLIHDLYPVGLEERVIEALDTVRPYMESHGGNVELVGDRGRRREAGDAGQLQRLRGVPRHARAGDQAGARRARSRSRRAGGSRGLREPAIGGHGFELLIVHSAWQREPPMPDEAPPRWVAARARRRGSVPGELRALDVDGAALLLANVDGTLLAYRDGCASCGGPLQAGELDGRMLRCPGCAVEFDLPRAGRAAACRATATDPGSAAGRGRDPGGGLSTARLDRRSAAPGRNRGEDANACSGQRRPSG